MRENFIVKLQTNNYMIGSFDAYLDMSKALIKSNSVLSNEQADNILKAMPTAYRAAITDSDGCYIGYIGLFDVKARQSITSIRFEVNTDLKPENMNEILVEFKKYLSEALNLTQVEELIYKTSTCEKVKKNKISPEKKIIFKSNFLVPEVSDELFERLSREYYIPELQMQFTIKSKDKDFGIIGLSNLNESNKRADLCLFTDKSLNGSLSNEELVGLINEYIEYAHALNIHNVSLSLNAGNHNMLDIINNTDMNYYGEIPFAALNGDQLESKLMFQHIPSMKKEKGTVVIKNKSIPLSLLTTQKKEISKQLELDNGFKLLSPSSFENAGIDSNKILNAHLRAMQNRSGFAVPLGEDKYILQKGNGNYGISKAMNNFNYVLLNESNDYSGYVNILRNNANGKNAEIEIGIDPKLQHKGLGTKVINAFYNELFSIGYASVTGAVFGFNTPSLKLHKKVADFNGIRLAAYYSYGKLWDMHYYTKINPIIESL